MKIGILGMGGIGSFMGAKLAQNYADDEETGIIFICRGQTKETINENGLSLITGNQTITSKPYLVSDDPKEIGKLDLLIVAVKSYSLESAISKYQVCLQNETVIIPLQNGVNAKNIIKNSINYSNPKVLEGCIYVASNIEEPGVVKHVGGSGKVFFGNKDAADFSWVERILLKGGIEASYVKNIKEILWKKYLFVSPLAAMTTALDITFGELSQNPNHMARLEKMMVEVQNLANEFNVSLVDKDIADSLSMLSNFPHHSKSSLQLDFENRNNRTEKDNLVDFVIENGNRFRLNVDNYEEMNSKITASYSS